MKENCRMSILRKIFYFFLDTAQTILLASAVFLITYVFLFRPFQVSGESMVPNYHDSEYILTNLITLRFSEPEIGDVIVFKAPNDPGKDFIKRVIAGPSDTVMIRDNKVYVNGEILDESTYLPPGTITAPGTFLAEGESVTVPPGNYFVMGDNREFSSDSREWGFVPEDKIIGKSFFVYWPLDEVGFIHNPY